MTMVRLFTDDVGIKNGELFFLVKGQQMLADHLLRKNHVSYVKKLNENFSLKRCHMYYGQVQLGLSILNF